MSLHRLDRISLSLKAAQKREVRSQFGALCYRVMDGKPQILLVTSRGSGRWLVPKGWPLPGLSPARTAAQEAFEEAGAEGRMHPGCLGIYSYVKDAAGARMPCVVALYALRVKRLYRQFPENGQRKRKWVSQKRAGSLVDEPELAQLIAGFEPSLLPR